MEIELPYNWEPRSYQRHLWKYMQGPQEGKRGVAVWHRRAGKDLMAINIISTKIPQRVGTYWHMLPTYKQGRAIVWNGHTRDGRAFLDHFHPALIASKNSTEMRITFTNGAHYQVVGTDNIDSLVGTNPVGVVFSEYSLQDPGAWDYIRPILAENGGWALFIYTARGRNHGFSMYEMARKNPKWFCERLVAGSGSECTKRPDGTPVISDEVIDEERKSGMPEEMIQQEFKCSFEAPFIGSYYGTQMLIAEKDGRIMENIPHDDRLLVDTYWDLGMNDTTTIWFVQHYGGEERIIDYYEMSGEGLPHYAKLLRGQVSGYERMAAYTYGKNFAPHDIKVRELGSGKSREETARSLGIRFQMVKRHEVEDGIEAVRSVLGNCWFSQKNCQRGIDALRAYRKAWDDKNKIFQSHPLHDWASNGADAFRMFAMGRKDKPKNSQAPQQRAVDEYQYI